ncbi:MAG: hypothetical protein U0136_08405 [Bdellovibrionota bacterium]
MTRTQARASTNGMALQNQIAETQIEERFSLTEALAVPPPGFLRRHAFHLSVGSFVVVVSFLYGISVGLNRKPSSAFASGGSPWALVDTDQTLHRLQLPAGVIAAPMGKDITINNHAAEIVSFVSDRAAEQIVNEQIGRWKQSGMKVVGLAKGKRGFAIGLNEVTQERFSISAWTVPPTMRGSLSGGHSVQGVLQVADTGIAESETVSVPDVPLMPGGKGGAVFSALDPGGRSYSSVYTNPGSIADSLAFYRNELTGAGWQELNSDLSQPDGSRFEVGNVVFRKDGEEIVLLFSPLLQGGGVEAPASSDSSPEQKTVLAITRMPMNIERWRAPQ